MSVDPLRYPLSEQRVVRHPAAVVTYLEAYIDLSRKPHPEQSALIPHAPAADSVGRGDGCTSGASASGWLLGSRGEAEARQQSHGGGPAGARGASGEATT